MVRGRRTDAPAAAADEVLKRAEAGVRLNQRRPPEDFDADALKARVVSAIESLARAR